MRKGAFILFLFVFFISCQQKTKETQKTYEEIEAEVLCDVLPEVIPEINVQPPPPPLPSDSLSQKTNNENSNEEFIKMVKIAKDRLRTLTKEKNKYKIGIIDTLRFMNYTYYKNLFPEELKNFNPTHDSLIDRTILKKEVEKSTLLINLYNIEYLPHMTSNHNHNEHTIISIFKSCFKRYKR
ncbi:MULTISPECIES: hypothetical protein [Flavobacterium]|uniref:Uncharacterized protein n=1 Tax=Flavobacterium jumunjinense TaxID=998845 RepID=A0ABV5GQZ3_9FLAO|nr:MULTISPECIES: hypothetical protein [Flavobacterium]